MFREIKKSLIINTDHIVYYDRAEKRIEMSTGEEFFVDEEYDVLLLSSFQYINTKESTR